MIYYKLVKVIIDAFSLAKVIFNVVVQYYSLLESIMSDYSSVFTSKFWSSPYYFFEIKQKLFTAFYPQTDGQIKRQNSTIEVYFRVFINFEQNNWVRLLSIDKFVYNNAKNTSTGYTLFELNCGYHLCVSYKKNVAPKFKSKSAEELSNKLRELMTVC